MTSFWVNGGGALALGGEWVSRSASVLGFVQNPIPRKIVSQRPPAHRTAGGGVHHLGQARLVLEDEKIGGVLKDRLPSGAEAASALHRHGADRLDPVEVP